MPVSDPMTNTTPTRRAPARIFAAIPAGVLAACFALTGPLPAQDPGHPYESVLHRMLDYGGAEFDAPEGYWIFDSPSLNGNLVRRIDGPTTLNAMGYVETEGTRFYLTQEGFDGLWEGRAPGWPLVIGTGRPDFIAATEPARVLISRLSQREATVRGSARGSVLAQALHPGSVWAAAISEGRIQELRLG